MITRPMLAAKATDEELQALFRMGRSYLLSPKIDGFRGVGVGGHICQRSMKLVRNYHTQSLFGRPELEGLDGELVVGNPWDKNLMQQVSSGVGSYQGRPNVSFHVFDDWSEPGPFKRRLDVALDRVAKLSEDFCLPIFPVPHHLVSTYENMLVYEEGYLAQGYEGVMLRRLDGPYKQNRSTLKEAYLVKVKRFEDGEAIIRGTAPLYRNLNVAQLDERGYTKRSHEASGRYADELLGNLDVTDLTDGVQFSIGSGFTEAQRRDLWANRDNLLGKIVKYKSFKNAGVKDAPRHPIFLGFRDKDDM